MSSHGVVTYLCPFCGLELAVSDAAAACVYCGTRVEGDYVCARGHCICEACRLADPPELIAAACAHSVTPDPRKTADLIMRHPSWPAHGPQHHLLVAPVLLTALGAAGVLPRAAALLPAALERCAGIPAGACASRGDCGACAGAAAALSLLLRAGFASGRERNLVLETMAAGLLLLAGQGAGRCCKQSVYAALEAAEQTLASELGIRLDSPPRPCAFAAAVPDCRGKSCRYHEHA
jgi:hypothetical protein